MEQSFALLSVDAFLNPPARAATLSQRTMTSNEGSSVITQPLQVHDRCQVQWRGGQQFLLAVIVERRLHRASVTGIRRKRRAGGDIGVDIDSLPACAVDYYVHYLDHDRCVDERCVLSF